MRELKEKDTETFGGIFGGNINLPSWSKLDRGSLVRWVMCLIILQDFNVKALLWILVQAHVYCLFSTHLSSTAFGSYVQISSKIYLIIYFPNFLLFCRDLRFNKIKDLQPGSFRRLKNLCGKPSQKRLVMILKYLKVIIVAFEKEWPWRVIIAVHLTEKRKGRGKIACAEERTMA